MTNSYQYYFVIVEGCRGSMDDHVHRSSACREFSPGDQTILQCSRRDYLRRLCPGAT